MILDVQVGNDLSKGKDVDTSKAAWGKAKYTAAESRQAVLGVLKANPFGATCKEIANILNKPMHAVSGRITELIEIGAVRKTEVTRDGGRVIRYV